MIPQLLKWIGNKQKYADKIISYFPKYYGTYFEPFLGSGAVLGSLAPKKGIVGDINKPLIEIWNVLKSNPDDLIAAYTERWQKFNEERLVAYNGILKSYNEKPNYGDLLFISRSCYGGVLRFTKQGKISTPIGAHDPIKPHRFAERVSIWHKRIINTEFLHADYKTTLSLASEGDIIYCDPPYIDTQAIIYGAQEFDFYELVKEIIYLKNRGVKVVLSLDRKKKSGDKLIQTAIPSDLFESEMEIDCGKSMLRRFQKKGEIMIGETVHDMLAFTWKVEPAMIELF